MSTLISTRGRYALRALTDIAEHQDQGPVSLSEVAARQGISEKYLESIAMPLARCGIIQGQRGKGGGYRLAVEPKQCSIASILNAVEGDVVPVACLECDAVCDNRDVCRTLPIWMGLDDVIQGYLRSKTLADLLHGEGMQ